MKTIKNLNQYDVLGAIIKVESTFREVLLKSPFFTKEEANDYILDDISDEIIDISNILGFTYTNEYWLNGKDNVKISIDDYLDALWSVCLRRRGCSDVEIEKLLKSPY